MKLAFLDESSVNCGMTRLYGRAMTCRRVNGYVPDVRFERASIMSDFLAPTLAGGDVPVLDNLPSHKVAGSLDSIFERGASVLFLPPYSPDLNPIEMSWSKMKSALRKLKPRTHDELIAALQIALGSFTEKDIQNWFAHDGYIINK